MRVRAATLAAAAMAAALPAAAQVPTCPDGPCRVRLTPQQLLSAAERMVADGKYDSARPILRALAQAPGFTFQTRFLTGYIDAAQGRWPEAAEQYKAILADDPGQTRVRLELAKAMLAMKQYGAADRQFAIAERDRELSPEITRTIRTVRSTIRAARPWQLDVAVGIAPDSNINSATAADTVTVMLGDTPVPLSLDDAARARSGLGATARVSGSLRLPVAARLSAIADLDASGTEYKGADYDSYVVQLAAGAEYAIKPELQVSLAAVGAQRWFGDQVVSRQAGARAGLQAAIDRRRRLGVQLDLRHTDALFNDGYSGWQTGLYATYEQAITPALVVSAGPFVRRDWLREKAYSSTEYGANLGIGGELKWGVTFGASAGASRSTYDAPLRFFDPEPRRDWLFNARATLGNRKWRVWGLSPQVGWTLTRIDSSLGFYSATRSRFELTLARYF